MTNSDEKKKRGKMAQILELENRTFKNLWFIY